MIRLRIFAFIFLMTSGTYGQTGQEINKLVDSLSWNSINYDFMHMYILKSEAKKLIEIGNPAIEPLLNSIDNPEKTVIVHFILTGIFEPNNNDNSIIFKYIYQYCDTLIGWHHIYNGLIWEWYSDSTYSIENSEIIRVKKYWSDRKSGNIYSWEKNTEIILKNLFISDSIDYPCENDVWSKRYTDVVIDADRLLKYNNENIKKTKKHRKK